MIMLLQYASAKGYIENDLLLEDDCSEEMIVINQMLRDHFFILNGI